jgi:hypothetical protein
MSRTFSGWLLRHRLLFIAAVAIVFQVQLASASDLNLFQGSQGAGPQGTDVFAAVEAGDLEVGVVPQNERRVTIQLKNISNRTLTIQLPPALAAVPILAQQPGLFPGFPNPGGQNQNQQQAPQQLGVGMNGGNQGGNNGGGNLFGGMFHIPAGRAIKIKADAVCLEYGKPSPDARMKYELRPLAEVCDKPELAAVLTSLGKDQIDQRSAQAAAWHVTDDLSFNKLAGLLRREVGATKEYQFTRDQVAAAQSYLAKLPAKKQPANSQQKVASSR